MGEMTSYARRPRVLLIVDRLAVGGAERVVIQLATNLDRDRFEVAVCTTREAGPLSSLVTDAGIPVFDCGRTGKVDPFGLARLYAHIRSFDPDVIHSHMFGSNVWGRLLGKLARVPVVIAHEHTWSYEGDRKRVVIDRQLARLSSQVLAPSQYDAERLTSIVGIPANRVSVVYNGSDDMGTPRDSDAVQAFPWESANGPVIGAVGSLRPQKRYDVLIRAFHELADRFPSANLVIAGEGPMRSSLEAMIDDFGLQPRVHLLGARNDIRDLLTSFDVYVNASAYEGMPVAVLEAMSAGRAIVATEAGGTPETFIDGDSGILVPPGDSRQLSDEIARLLPDAQLRGSIGSRARERWEEFFRLDRMIGNVSTIYESCLEH
jgi:glycosyltransferase involved in cell wall biosynthesis